MVDAPRELPQHRAMLSVEARLTAADLGSFQLLERELTSTRERCDVLELENIELQQNLATTRRQLTATEHALDALRAERSALPRPNIDPSPAAHPDRPPLSYDTLRSNPDMVPHVTLSPTLEVFDALHDFVNFAGSLNHLQTFACNGQT